MPALPPALEQAIANAYRVFAKYRLSGSLILCTCQVCVGPEAERELNTLPVRNMPVDTLAEYTHSAHGWNDDIDLQFRRFVPRYFELIAVGTPPTKLSQATCLERLKEAEYRSRWPREDADAVDAFFLALLGFKLLEPPGIDRTGLPSLDGDAVEDVLCMAAHAGVDMALLLKAWDEDQSRNATLHLGNIIGAADWLRKRLRQSWWVGMKRPHTEAAMQQLIQWLFRPQTRERLEAECLAEDDTAAATLLSHAEGIVAAMIQQASERQ